MVRNPILSIINRQIFDYCLFMSGGSRIFSMTHTDFEIDTTGMECSYSPAENGLLSCSLHDQNGIQKEVQNVSFLFVEPTTKYRSSFFYKNIAEPNGKIPTQQYEFASPLSCRVTGTEKSTTINCQDL